MRRFAEDTSVPVAKSRAEIDRLLRDWGSAGVQWTDDWQKSVATVRFAWTDKHDRKFMARFTVELPSRNDLEKHAIDGRSGTVSERKLEALIDARGKREHRLLLSWLKAAFNAVEAGIVTPEALFLPFLEGQDGKTVAEKLVPRMDRLLVGDARRLLED